MIPTEEEKGKILEAQLAHPDVPLGTAEQFLLTLSSISELQARLNLWLFKLDYENIESVRTCSSYLSLCLVIHYGNVGLLIEIPGCTK